MTRKQRAALIEQILNETIPAPAIPLYHEDPYTLLIAVLLSAQCTDHRVNQVTPHLFAKAKTPVAMVQLRQSEVEEIIRPCGLAPTKAKAILGLSRMLLENYDGKVPESLTELEKLPGVGHKTASVVMVQAFHQPAFPVDTHIHRCAKRWGLSGGKNVEETERDLKRLFPPSSWGRIHLQIILFAREFCSAKKHQPEQCPICSKLHKSK